MFKFKLHLLAERAVETNYTAGQVLRLLVLHATGPGDMASDSLLRDIETSRVIGHAVFRGYRAWSSWPEARGNVSNTLIRPVTALLDLFGFLTKLSEWGAPMSTTLRTQPQSAEEAAHILRMNQEIACKIGTCSNTKCPGNAKRLLMVQQGQAIEPLKTCGRCHAVHYCSERCQREHWRATHKEDCTRLAADVAAAVELDPDNEDAAAFGLLASAVIYNASLPLASMHAVWEEAMNTTTGMADMLKPHRPDITPPPLALHIEIEGSDGKRPLRTPVRWRASPYFPSAVVPDAEPQDWGNFLGRRDVTSANWLDARAGAAFHVAHGTIGTPECDERSDAIRRELRNRERIFVAVTQRLPGPLGAPPLFALKCMALRHGIPVDVLRRGAKAIRSAVATRATDAMRASSAAALLNAAYIFVEPGAGPEEEAAGRSFRMHGDEAAVFGADSRARIRWEDTKGPCCMTCGGVWPCGRVTCARGRRTKGGGGDSSGYVIGHAADRGAAPAWPPAVFAGIVGVNGAVVDEPDARQ